MKKSPQQFHSQYKGKIGTLIYTPVTNKEDLSLAYTPGVAEVCKEIATDKSKVYDYTLKNRTVAVITDGSAVLGLGNIGPEAALPVMEGKALLFKTFANIDAFPICLNTQDTAEIIFTIKNIAPVFGGINLEDISAPRCFEIENALQNIGIPVMHDDQHGTAVVVLAGLINSAKLKNKPLDQSKVVILGAGAAGNAIANILNGLASDVIVVDSKGILSKTRNDLDVYKNKLLEITNKNDISGQLNEAIKNADYFIGVSKGNILTKDHVKLMADKPVIFALANPTPEIDPNIAMDSGAYIIATGRSDYPNQVNNSLAFPGIFKGALQVKAPQITMQMKISAANALANLVKDLSKDKIIPGPFDSGICDAVSAAING